ncbi:hypothetical protein QOT17_003528 [Balamuthia mandrillaris]
MDSARKILYRAEKTAHYHLLTDFKARIRSSNDYTPLWFGPMWVNPPPEWTLRHGRVPALRHPEDRLRVIWNRRNVHAQRIGVDTNPGEEGYWRHPGDVFVRKQYNLMKKGVKEAEAYAIVEEEMRKEFELRNVERILHVEQAADEGISLEGSAEELASQAEKMVAYLDKPSLESYQVFLRQEALHALIARRKSLSIRQRITPEELPKGMTTREIVEFLNKFPESEPYINTELLDLAALTHSPLGTTGDQAVTQGSVISALEKELDDLHKISLARQRQQKKEVATTTTEAAPTPESLLGAKNARLLESLSQLVAFHQHQRPHYPPQQHQRSGQGSSYPRPSDRPSSPSPAAPAGAWFKL